MSVPGSGSGDHRNGSAGHVQRPPTWLYEQCGYLPVRPCISHRRIRFLVQLQNDGGHQVGVQHQFDNSALCRCSGLKVWKSESESE